MGAYPLCLLLTYLEERTGVERKQEMKGGHIVLKNPMYKEFSTYEITW